MGKAKRKALMLIGGEWHPFEACAEILKGQLESWGTARVEVTSDRGALGALEGYDLVIVYAQGRKLTAAQERALTGFVRAGGGLAGIHCAADAFVENAAYMEMLGSRFLEHGPVTRFRVDTGGPDHDVTRRIAPFWQWDEFYILESKADAYETLATATWHGRRHPMVYVRRYGKGRVFYTALGHDERAFRNPSFQRLLHRAVRHVTGRCEHGPVRSAIVGYGPAFDMGREHARSIERVAGMEVVAVCDTDPARLRAAEEEIPGVRTFRAVAELARDPGVDLGVVVTPHNTHARIARTLLAGGKHVVCEKPFSIRTTEATAMIEAARAAGRMLSAFHNRRWDGDYVTIRRLLASGRIGEVFHVEAGMGAYGHPGVWWRSHKPISGGAFYDWGAHIVDWTLGLVPYPIETVSGFFHKKVWHDVTNEDYVSCVVRFEGGRTAMIEMGSIVAISRPKWRILGTRGAISCDWGDEAVLVVEYRHGTRNEERIPIDESDWDAYYVNVADHLLTGAPLAVTPESARRVIAVIERAERSSKRGRPERFPLD